jgi:hypothetical protein
MTKFRQATKILLAAFILLFPVLASAHGIETSQAKDVNDYTVEFEYNSGENITAGDYILYNTYLLKAGTETGVDFDYVFFEIKKQTGPAVLAASLKESADNPGYAAMGGIIPEPGAYVSVVTFYKNGKTLTEAEFNFEVSPSTAGVDSDPSRNALVRRIVVSLALLLGLGLGFWAGRMKI